MIQNKGNVWSIKKDIIWMKIKTARKIVIKRILIVFITKILMVISVEKIIGNKEPYVRQFLIMVVNISSHRL